MDVRAKPDLDELQFRLIAIQSEMERLQDEWKGIVVELTEPIMDKKGRTLMPQGSVGQVVRVRQDFNAPLAIKFPNSSLPIAPILDKLRVIS